MLYVVKLSYCYVSLFRDVDMRESAEACEEGPRKLWVDRYAPRTYTDLLSEEVNVSLFSLAFKACRKSFCSV